MAEAIGNEAKVRLSTVSTEAMSPRTKTAKKHLPARSSYISDVAAPTSAAESLDALPRVEAFLLDRPNGQAKMKAVGVREMALFRGVMLTGMRHRVGILLCGCAGSHY